MSMANDIALELSNRLSQITIVNGYATDIGLKVLRGRKRLDESHLPCAVLVERDDQVLEQNLRGTAKVQAVYMIEGHASCDPDNPNDTGHKLIADIKRAIFKDMKLLFGVDSTQAVMLKYRGRSISPREDGITVVAAGVEISVEYVESLANP